MVVGGEQDELRRLREENARLKELLTHHGIAWEEQVVPEPVSEHPEPAPVPTHFTTDNKIALFRRLFRRRWKYPPSATEHLSLLQVELGDKVEHCYVLTAACRRNNEHRFLPN